MAGMVVMFVLCGCGAAGRSDADPGATLAFTDVNVIDISTGVVLPHRTVRIAGEHIIDVAPFESRRWPGDVQVIPASGGYLIPGLWDMHVHAARAGRAPRFWPLFIAHGVTGVRETGSFLDSLTYWRSVSAVSPGAPHIVWSSPMLDGNPPLYAHGLGIADVAEARATIARLEPLGFDYLKVYSGLRRDVFFALADEARQRGMTIAGEVPDAVSPGEAATAGMRSFEHLWNLFEACVPGASELRDTVSRLERSDTPESVRRAAEAARYRLWVKGPDPECVERLAIELHAADVWQVPTLVVNRSYSRVDSLYTDDPNRCWVPTDILEEWSATQAELISEYGPAGIAAWRARYEHEGAMLLRMAEAGVGIMAGSDASDEPFVYAGASLHEELGLLVGAGLSPLQALQAATLNPAAYLGRSDLGRVAAGTIADLVLLDANPLDDIGNTKRIRAVVSRGRYLDRDSLDHLLASALPPAAGDAPEVAKRACGARAAGATR